MSKKIITAPNPILRHKSTSVVEKNAANLRQQKTYIHDLQSTLVGTREAIGVGLALPQIGKNKRVFSTYLPATCNMHNSDRPNDEETAVFHAYIDPVIVVHSSELTLGPKKDDPILEGCLSIPGVYGSVPRFEWLELAYLDENQQTQQQRFYGFYARVIQHEFDHLEGILFTDYVLRYKLPLFARLHGEELEEIDPSIAKTW